MVNPMKSNVKIYFYVDPNGTGYRSLVYGIKKGDQLIGFDGKNYNVKGKYSLRKVKDPYTILDVLEAYVNNKSKGRTIESLVKKGKDSEKIKPYVEQMEIVKHPKEQLQNLKRILKDEEEDYGL